MWGCPLRHAGSLWEGATRLKKAVIDRCNLTVLFEPGQEVRGTTGPAGAPHCIPRCCTLLPPRPHFPLAPPPPSPGLPLCAPSGGIFFFSFFSLCGRLCEKVCPLCSTERAWPWVCAAWALRAGPA